MIMIRNYICLALFLLLFTGCVSYSKIPIKDANISQIQVNILNYENIEYKNEIEKFEQEIVKVLNAKGYQPILGKRDFNSDWVGGLSFDLALKKIIADSPADAFLVFRIYKMLKRPLYALGSSNDGIFYKEIDKTFWDWEIFSWLFDRKGNIMVQTPPEILFNRRIQTLVVYASGTEGFSKGPVLNRAFEIPLRALETEDQFIARAAKALIDNIPNKQ